jgi:hypothetical protein
LGCKPGAEAGTAEAVGSVVGIQAVEEAEWSWVECRLEVEADTRVLAVGIAAQVVGTEVGAGTPVEVESGTQVEVGRSGEEAGGTLEAAGKQALEEAGGTLEAVDRQAVEEADIVAVGSRSCEDGYTRVAPRKTQPRMRSSSAGGRAFFHEHQHYESFETSTSSLPRSPRWPRYLWPSRKHHPFDSSSSPLLQPTASESGCPPVWVSSLLRRYLRYRRQDLEEPSNRHGR